ncbi:MAG TPA: heterodisulfide reductase-related iron-sulfur binding cluster [Gemmatimonadaceae bacterium]|nr:heterodisulfide reductase-related iron-sulfur binding cluster [Gemmatimonadaceae bacterium]
MTAAAERPACAAPGTPLGEAIPGIMTCVHCGFCLQSCPTYTVLGDENDSPRGRILLMRSLAEGEIDIADPSLREHIDRCLGCRACETVCPSGVPYGALLEATRATLVRERRAPLTARLVLWLFARPLLLGAVLAMARAARALRLPALLAHGSGRIGFACGMLASTAPPIRRRRYAPCGSGTRGRAAILRGCVMHGLFRETNRATERTLAANDYDVVHARGQRCCGALHAHAGALESARALARANIAAFERSGADVIAVNASGCGAAMKEYGHLLSGDPEWAERAATFASRVHDVSELLAEAGPAPGGPLPLTVTYDAPCHLVHAQRITAPPLAVLSSIPELQLVPLADADRCCGSAGIYNLLEPDLSSDVLAPKLAAIAATKAPFVATGNPGCLMQIGAGLARERSRVRAVHLVDLLDASYAARQP